MDVDITPVLEALENLQVGGLIRRSEIAQRLIREHDAPAIGLITPVALDHRHVVLCGSARFISNAKYGPAGPPPTQTIRMARYPPCNHF
jgi:hypothetical protein